MPGDELIEEPIWSATHAISIPVPFVDVWPWLAQMGADRAGWYSWDVLDNGRRPSARAILPELQDLHVGDVVPALPGATEAFVVEDVEPSRHLVLGVPDGVTRRATWAFVVEEDETGGAGTAPGSRLLVRARLGRLVLAWPVLGQRTMPKRFVGGLAEAVHWIMVRRQLHGIRQRCLSALPGSRSS